MEGIALEDYIKNQKVKTRDGKKKTRSTYSQKNGKSKPFQSIKKSEPSQANTPAVWKKQLLIVENLPLNFNNESLKALLSKFGELTRSTVLFDIKGDSKVG